jgi:hypothetical protein
MPLCQLFSFFVNHVNMMAGPLKLFSLTSIIEWPDEKAETVLITKGTGYTAL